MEMKPIKEDSHVGIVFEERLEMASQVDEPVRERSASTSRGFHADHFQSELDSKIVESARHRSQPLDVPLGNRLEG